jgi:hypothetical protein
LNFNSYSILPNSSLTKLIPEPYLRSGYQVSMCDYPIG